MSMNNKSFKFVFGATLACAVCAGCGQHKAVVDSGEVPDYWEQKVYGDSLSAFPSSPDDYDVYPFGMKFQPLDDLSFLPHTVLEDYWKTKHLLSFKNFGNHLVFEEYPVESNVNSYPIIYASITDSRILLNKGIFTGMRRADVLRLLKLKNVSSNIQKVCLTTNRDASVTFNFADGLLKKVVIRTDRELLRNPDPIFENRHAGQVKGYTGKRLYAVRQEADDWLSSVCYVNEKGDTIVPYGRYIYCVSDSIAPIGFVWESGAKGIPCINTEGQELCRAMIVDNLTPDYLHEGHFRIVNESGQIGFADSLGHVVITPQYKYAYPFEGGRAKATNTGQKNNPNDEHWEWVSDDWFYIDYQGRRLP